MHDAETIRDLLQRAELRLVASGVPNARRNAEWMLCHALGLRMLDLYVQSTAAPDPNRATVYRKMVERRAAREPLQYILGTTEFMSLPFEVGPGVFVPRPDTEVLVERAEELLRSRPLHEALEVLDLCSGSGIIGISLAARIPNLAVVAVDVSSAAVAATARNAATNGVSERVEVVRADAFAYLRDADRRFAAVVCNPPYIESGELAALPREVREHEPLLALDGGRDGLDFYRRVVPELARRVAPGGFVMFEIGDTQGVAVSKLLRDAGFAPVEVVKDYAGRDRVVIGFAGTGR
jgi:release factor glutamine methyltransferase